jgi:multiple sugar transport system substrate-binding protein
MLAGGLALGGAIIGANVNRTQSLGSNFARSRILSITREPLLVAMLESHASRISPLIPEIESALNRSLSIEALPADQLYANYTIDLLQQTGRYDAVSMNDAWIPYFGRRGYLTAVPELERQESQPSYPVPIHASARGVDGTELVAYPWTCDYTCAAAEHRLGLQDWSRNWTDFFPAAASVPDAHIGVALRAPSSAAETFRSILLSYGDDLVEADTHQPRLDSYAARRALETTVRLAKLGDPQTTMTRSLTQLPGLALDGGAEVLPVVWAADTKRLWASGAWTFNLVPVGRMAHASTAATFWMWGVPAGAPSVEKARAFVQIMTSMDIQSKLWESGGLLPATRPAINGEWEPGARAMKQLTLAALDRSRFRPQLRAFRSLMDIAGQMVADVVSGNDDAESRRLRANEQMRTVLIQEGELKS